MGGSRPWGSNTQLGRISFPSWLPAQASFDNQLAKAELDASDQKASFDNQLAKAALDASDQKASFDNHLAKAALDAGDQKVC